MVSKAGTLALVIIIFRLQHSLASANSPQLIDNKSRFYQLVKYDKIQNRQQAACFMLHNLI